MTAMAATVLRQGHVRSILKCNSHGPISGKSKRVIFDRVSVQKYPIILGDNPAV